MKDTKYVSPMLNETRCPMKDRPAVMFLCTALAVFAQPVTTRPATNRFAVANSGFSSYLINGTSNPNLTLVRGFTYTFQVNASGHPFWIKTVQGSGTGNSYNTGVTGNGTAVGTVQFSISTNAPSLLYYNCQFHPPMTGELRITDPPEVVITQLATVPVVQISSTGTDALNIGVETRTNLTEGAWMPVVILGNTYADGTNTTQITKPPWNTVFFRVYQGFP